MFYRQYGFEFASSQQRDGVVFIGQIFLWHCCDLYRRLLSTETSVLFL